MTAGARAWVTAPARDGGLAGRLAGCGLRRSGPVARSDLNKDISDPFRFGGAIRVDRGLDYLGRKRGTGPRPARAARIAPSLHPLALPRQGMRFCVIVINVAAPDRSAHHPGITPGGVICGHRDNSAIGRSLRARALACLYAR
jgi:hypothetical protein